VFNIGKLRADSVDYYVGGVARTATDYYFGRGEAAGRWAGSLAPELGLAGTVDEEHLRRLLDGLHPHTGDLLVSAIGSNARARRRDGGSRAPARAPNETERGGVLAVAQVAAQLKVSTRAVRHWLAAGERVRTLVQAATPQRVLADADEVRIRLDELGAAGTTPIGLPERFLLGGRLPDGAGAGHDRWRLTQGEVDILRDARQVVSAQAGWDLVFRPPKGFSVLWAVGGDDVGGAIHAIHTQAVDTALAYLEDAAIAARTAYHRRVVRTEAEGLVVAVFDHRESRAGDPLLHSHCVVANVTRRGDGRFVALEPRGLYRHGLAADAVYQATFRHLAELRLGLATEPVVHGWADLAGVPRAVVEHFSKRSDEIAAELARIGSDSPQARQLAALATRRAKGTPEGDVGLHDRWRAEAEAVGFGAEQIAACLGRAGHPAARALDTTRLDALFDRLAGPAGLTHQTATFTRADVICALATALGSAVDGRGVVALADRFLASGRVCPVPEHRPGQPRPRILTAEGEFVADLPNLSFTTPELVAIEDRLLFAATTAEVTGTARLPVAPQPAVDTALTARPELDDQQRAMVEAVCRSPRIIRLVVGHPGAGKTYAAEAAVAAFRHAGIHVVGCAVTAEAADELAASTGLGWGTGTCGTLARLLLDLDEPQYGGLPPGAVVLVDEASTVPHRELDRLLGHVTRAGGALVLMGDPKQHGAVGPGGFFAWAVTHLSEHVSVLSANHRQRDVTDDHGEVLVSLAEERLANEEYRAGHIAESLDRRDAAGLVVRAETAGALYDAMASDWFVEWHAGARDPMIATRNSVREELNRRARVLRAAAGELGEEAVVTAGREIRLGDYVVTRRNDRRLRSPDGTWFVKNGSRGAVVGVDIAAGDVVVDFEGRAGAVHRVRLPAAYLECGHVEWAYAVTDYGVQGRTLTKGKAVLDDATRAAGAYVATTRGRLENRIYVVDGMVSESADPDVGHGRPGERMASMERIAHRLAADEPDALLHEQDPHLAQSGPLAGAATLADLHIAAEEVTAVLRSGPPDVAGRLIEEEQREAVLLARRRVAEDRLAAVLSAPGGRAVAARRETLVERYRRTLRAIDGQLAATGTRIGEIRVAARARAVFVDDTATERAAVDVLHDATALRDATVRLGVLSAPPIAEPGPPPEPSRRQERLAYRRALERVALHRDRFGAGPGPDPDTAGSDAVVVLLGPRPDDPKARRSWDLTAAALSAARRPDPSPSPARPFVGTGLEPATGIEP
jgi:conjugative relaxase-like TrwC/TraI family protein